MTLTEAALQYATRGWPVLPLHNMHAGQCSCGRDGCKSKAKHPRTRHGLTDASIDETVIRGWWGKWPNANIGITTGDRSFVVVDLDTKEHDGIQAFNDLRDTNLGSGAKMAQTLIAKTGGGGMHLCFEPRSEVRNTQSDLAPGIDTRGEGGYIVVAPSVHESGEVYKWLSPHDTPLAPIPEWLVPRKTPVVPKPPPVAPSTPVPVDQAMQRAQAYIQQMEPAVQGSGGHGALYAAATVLVHGFDLPDYQAIQLLTNEFNPRCMPPWDLSIPAESKDFRRKVTQARAQEHDQPRGWLIAAQGFQEPTTAAVAHGRTVAESILQGPNQVTLPSNLPAEPDNPEPQCETVQVPTMPEHLLKPPGYVGRLVEWMNGTAYVPQPILNLANALAFWGAVVGQKVRDESDLRTNLYCLGVGDSGCGKDHSRKCIKKLCKMAGIDKDVLGGEDIASDAAILSAVERRPSLIFQLDEIGHLLASTSSKQAATYQKAIPVTLTKLFSSASTTFIGKEYGGERERIDIDQPNVCLYGTTVPDRFFEGITTAEVRDGFLGRMLVFQSTEPDPEPCEHVVTDVPGDLVMIVQEWIKKKIEVPGANLLPFLIAQQMVIKLDSGASRIFQAFQRHARKTRMDARSANNQAAACLWSRAYENARKIALTIAAGEGVENLVINAQHAEYAIQLVTFLVERLIQSVADNVADNETERAKAKIMALVGKHKGRVTKSMITRRIRVPRRTREDAIKDLIEGEQLATMISQGATKSTIIYCFPSLAPK